MFLQAIIVLPVLALAKYYSIMNWTLLKIAIG